MTYQELTDIFAKGENISIEFKIHSGHYEGCVRNRLFLFQP